MKYLLTGGSGTLGTELQKHLDCWAPDRSVYDISWSFSELPIMLSNVGIDLYNCQGIIHAAAYTNVPGSETNTRQAVETNIVATKNVSRLGSSMFRLPVYYISTDYVYPGHVGNYKETDKTEPVNFYGFTKLAGEAFFDPDRDLVIRTSFKPNKQWPYKKAFDDLYTSADYVDVIAPKIASLIVGKARGIYNVGTERKSIYELAMRRNTEVEPMSRKEIKDVHLPTDISMNLDKFNNF